MPAYESNFFKISGANGFLGCGHCVSPGGRNVYRDEEIIRPSSVRSDICQWISLLTELKTKLAHIAINISSLRGLTATKSVSARKI